MSDETKNVLEDAIKDHFASETGGGLLLDYVLFSAGPAHDSDVIDYVFEESHSSPHAIMGLARMGVREIEGYGENSDEA